MPTRPAMWSVPSTRAWGLVCVIGWGYAAEALSSGEDGPPPGYPCITAAMVDGELRCDEERSVRCPGAPELVLVVAPGDAVQTDVVCQAARHGTLDDSTTPRMAPEDLERLGQIVDINRASVTELASLPGIGDGIARKIVAGRPYATVEALLDVPGIGAKRLSQLRRRARVVPG